MTGWRKFANLMAVFILLGFFGIFLYGHLKLGLERFLDLDEYAHLHWSFNASYGLVPYRDFFYIFTPFYLYLIAPIVLLTGKTFTYVISARIFSFVVYCLGVIFLFLIAKRTKNLLFALFTVLAFAYLPLPADKWIEVRPDGLGTVLSLVGTFFLLEAINRGRNYFWAGFFMSLGFVVNPKTVFYLVSVLIVLVFAKRVKRLSFFLGVTIPVLVLVLLFFFFGDFGRAFYSSFILHKEAGTLLNWKSPMRADLFFYPNDIYYGEAGYNFNYFANLLIYLLAIITAIIRLVSFLSEETREKAAIRLFLALLLLTNLVAYIKLFPLKHTQYLMGTSPFVAYFFADFVFGVWDWVKKRKLAWKVVYMVLLLVFIILMAFEGGKMNEIKASRTKIDSVRFLEEAQKTFVEDEYIFDLTGASLFYKDPYYVCCLPYGEYFEVLGIGLPNLEEALRQHEVKHIFTQFPERVRVLPEQHRLILSKYYTNIPGSSAILYARENVEFNK